jgi:hypothetical protein
MSVFDSDGTELGKHDLVIWASTSGSPHAKYGVVINTNEERGTLTARAFAPERDRGSVATVPAERTLKALALPVISVTE